MIYINNIKSYVINLEKYYYKYELSLKRLNKINLKPERFNAIYIEDENSEEIKRITYPSVQYTIKNGRYSHNNIGTTGALGCYLSHVTLWKMLLESDEEMFLIFEDDVDINKNINNFTENINNTINLINENDWDIIFLGYFYNNTNNINIKYFKPINIIYGTHSYIINKNGARKLLKNAFPIVDQLDSYISYMSLTRNINLYCTKNVFFSQNNLSGTLIQTDNSIRPFITQYNDIILLHIFMFILLFFILIVCLYFDLKHNCILK